MDKSTHKVEIVPIKLDPHPNADSLSIVTVFGYTCCVKTEDWLGKDRGAYIPPDSVCPNIPEYAFLNGHLRIKVKKLRGIVSMGLLMPAPEYSQIGDNVAEQLGITHYEPPLHLSMGEENVKAPSIYAPCYDVDSLYRYVHCFQLDEPVYVTEKIHGANARFCYVNGEMMVGSRTAWKKETETNIWWVALKNNPELKQFCQDHPNYVVYGEVYGQVQDLTYGKKKGQIDVLIFDILRNSEWLSFDEARELGKNLPFVPLIQAHIPFNFEKLKTLAEGPSMVAGADNMREGIVIKPIKERTHPEIGRVNLKLISNEYLMRK